MATGNTGIDRRGPLWLGLLSAAVVAASGGCAYVPARFRDQPPVTRAPDDAPIALPRSRKLVVETYLADVHIRRALVGMLDPLRTPDARDVNALDEVVASSWYLPPENQDEPLGDCAPDGPPVEPLVVVPGVPPSGTPRAVAVRDARGLDYELIADLHDRAEARTAAAAIGSRLLCGLGYRTPEAWVIEVPGALFEEGQTTQPPAGEPPVIADARSGKLRVAAMRWPVGVDLGPTPMRSTRIDDPNDRVPHLDRRSLRALQLFTLWLRLDRIEPRMLRDAYVGTPGLGHVEHFLVSLGGALGVDALVSAKSETLNPDRISSTNFFFKLFTLGMSPKPEAPSSETAYRTVGLVDELLAPEAWSLAPPYEPGDRFGGADLYWAGKRLDALPTRVIREAVQSGALGSIEVAYWLALVLEERRRTVLAWAYGATTPVEVQAIEPAWEGAAGPSLVLADLAISAGVAQPMRTSYRVELLDTDGAEVRAPFFVLPRSDSFRVALPAEAVAKHDYLVVRVTASRDEEALPRAFEAHLISSGAGVRLVGVRH